MMSQQTAGGSAPPIDGIFRALADPTRRSVVERLNRSPASVSELAEPLDMTLSAVVQHLAVLEASGLVRSQKTGRVRTCRIEPKALQGARWYEPTEFGFEKDVKRRIEWWESLKKKAEP